MMPIKLEGINLGERHRHFNSLVDAAAGYALDISILDLQEMSPVDRLFKIELSSKHKHINYMIQNLKDEDMLYVSKALKPWLLDKEYSHIVNPSYLENVVYPDMTTTAVNKVKHWIHLHLKDNLRCEEFYKYYCDDNFNLAFQVFPKCSDSFIFQEINSVLHKLSPLQLKILSEKCPEIAKIFFEKLDNNEALLKIYLNDVRKYFESISCILKRNPNIFLEIVEKYFDKNVCRRLSPEATKYIITKHKSRFNKKPELYTAWFLHLETLAKLLNAKEIKELILTLARAQYLNNWFSYKNVEIFLKRLSSEDRKTFKKQVFVDKLFGEVVKDWPYQLPSTPEQTTTEFTNVLEDKKHEPYEYEFLDREEYRMFGKKLIKKKCAKYQCYDIMTVRKSSFDELFDRYRFVNFGKTLYELRKKMASADTKHRQNMMLVLVSKTGGHSENVEALLKLLLERHDNEPDNLRATIIRSLVKRASVWRLPDSVWQLLLRFGRGLGLDGKPSTVACSEGIHAVIIRNILLDIDCERDVWNAFLYDFTPFMEYSLTPSERKSVSTRLPTLLLNDVKANPSKAIERLNKILDVFDSYKIRADKHPEFISAVAENVTSDPTSETLLRRLYNSKVARRQLFRENFVVIKTAESYKNALKHDTSVLVSEETVGAMALGKNRFDKFLRPLALYFNERNGLAENYLSVLEKQLTSSPTNKLARPVAFLAKDKLPYILKTLDATTENSAHRSRALRSNYHLSRPLLDIDTCELFGAQAFTNRVIKCSVKNVEENIQKSLKWRRTHKLALRLSLRIGTEVQTLAIMADRRPRFTLKTALWNVKRGNVKDDSVWNVILPLITKLDAAGDIDDAVRKALGDVDIVPVDFKPRYCTIVYDILRKISRNAAMPMLCNLELIAPEIDDTFFEKVLLEFLRCEFIRENMPEGNHVYNKCACLYIRIIAKYLLICKTEEIQKMKLDTIGEAFLERIRDLWNNTERKTDLRKYIQEFIFALKNTHVFLDSAYVSPVPVFERVVQSLQMIMPTEKYFNIYAQLHLTMLYFKSIRQSIKNNPEIFDCVPKKLNTEVGIIGVIFGKYIAHETIELESKYFDSIRHLYKVNLFKYMQEYFSYCKTRNILVASVVKGILQFDNTKAHLLATYLFNRQSYIFSESVREEISNILEQSQSREVQIFLHVNLN